METGLFHWRCRAQYSASEPGLSVYALLSNSIIPPPPQIVVIRANTVADRSDPRSVCACPPRIRKPYPASRSCAVKLVGAAPHLVADLLCNQPVANMEGINEAHLHFGSDRVRTILECVSGYLETDAGNRRTPCRAFPIAPPE